MPVTSYQYCDFACWQISEAQQYHICLDNNTNKIAIARFAFNEQAYEDSYLIQPALSQLVPIQLPLKMHAGAGFIKCAFFRPALIPSPSGVLWQSANNSGSLPCGTEFNVTNKQDSVTYNPIPCAVITIYYGYNKAAINRCIDDVTKQNLKSD